jgi:hypothetical protein
MTLINVDTAQDIHGAIGIDELQTLSKGNVEDKLLSFLSYPHFLKILLARS